MPRKPPVDGAHHVCAEVFQALNDLGFSLAPNACTYWVGEAMGEKNYNELRGTPRHTAQATDMVCKAMVHMAQLLRAAPYPPVR